MDSAAATLLERLEAQVAAQADRPALVGDGTCLSYRALDAAASTLAERLRAAGAAPGTHVALLLPPDARRLVGALAALKAGCAYVPIDASLEPARTAELIAHARCSAVLSTEGESGTAVTATGAPGIARTGAAYLRFTSGSTGAPKAILHGQLAALRLAEAFADSADLGAQDRVTFFNPFWHTLVWGTLIAGGALHVFDLRAGPRALADWIDEQAITVYSSFPTAFRGFTAILDGKRRLASVRCLSLSGETLTMADVVAARRHFAPDCVLVNNYGASELGHIATCKIGPASELAETGIPVGLPARGVEILLLDDTSRPVPAGDSGDIAVRCAHLAAGYWERPDLTAHSYVADPARDGVLYLTGDVGRFDSQGRLHVIGRKDRQLKVRGHRIQPDEIAAALATHPAIAEAAVTGFAHWSGDTRLAAYVVARDGLLPEPKALRGFLAGHLPAYMVPLHVAVLDSLPRTAAGKIDWRALPAPSADLPPPSGRAPGAATALELQILQIWEEKLTARPIGLDDDFFDLGGDSMAATEVGLHLEALTGQALPITLVIETPTIRALARRIEAAEPERSAIATVNGAGPLLPLFFFHPDHRTAFYGIALARRLPGDQPTHVIGPQAVSPEALVPSFEAMGIAGADLVRRLQPEGPVAIAGFCNGALIALETARALAAAGRRVDTLVLVDPPSSHVLWPPLRGAIAALDGVLARIAGHADPVARLVGIAIHYAHRLRELGRESPSRWRAVARGRFARAVHGVDRTSPAPLPASGRDWYGALNDAGRIHLPRRIEAPLEVLLSEARRHNRYRPGRWRRIAPSAVIAALPGNHLGCITRESGALVAHLGRRLEGRRNENPGTGFEVQGSPHHGLGPAAKP